MASPLPIRAINLSADPSAKVRGSGERMAVHASKLLELGGFLPRRQLPLSMGGATHVQDFVLFDVSWMLNQKVTTLDHHGNELPDDGEYQRQGAEKLYVFAEFLQEKGLLCDGVDVPRRPDLAIRFSQLTEVGQRFSRAAMDKWISSLDRAGPKARIDASGLERRWKKFRS